jgi:hypothetical protein
MRPVDKFQTYSLSTATLIVFGIWIGLTKLPAIPDWIKLIITALMSFGVYKIVVVSFSGIIRKFKFIKRFILGPYYLEGTWVGFYIGASNNVRYIVERFEQEIDSLVIRGKSYNESSNYHSTWTTDTINIDVKKGKLTYMYDVDSIRDISNNVGIASFKFERENQYKAPKKLMGFSADLHISKKIKAIEIKINEKLSDSELLERAKSVYEENKNCF